jgi:mRNA interferase MazF
MHQRGRDHDVAESDQTGKLRPVLILLAQRYLDAGSPVVMAAPLTTQYWPGMAALRYPVTARGRLLKESFVVLELMRALDRSRFRRTCGLSINRS